ncbi:unnamed protein product [Rhodiola kirilowii]
MAPAISLPCDGDGVCMVCKQTPSEDETLRCKTCATPWHGDCLSSKPENLADTLQWECPDCLMIADPAPAPAVVNTSGASADILTAIRQIESDTSLSQAEKARKRQELLSGILKPSENVEKADKGIMNILDGSLNCSFCMQLLERPVTTPCGHNFCLKCFQKWTGQGKRTCANCRAVIPQKMASNPRINAAIVIAIRLAKMSKSNVPSTVPKIYHFVHNQNRPDKAYTTERAKKAGKANACSGKIFVTMPADHFGPITAEYDPERNTGVLVGESWEDRMECRQWGAHLPHVAGIAGQSDYGAQSVALSGGYLDDEDHGEWFLYTGSGGRDLSGNKRTNKEQSFDQKFDKSNEALRVSCLKGYPVRVVRSCKEKRSSYAPEKGVRYDGVYRIEKCWRKQGIQGFKVCRYLFVRCDNEPAPWTSDEHGDRPRPLPNIKELKGATDITERKGSPSWDYDEAAGSWVWKKPSPLSKKPMISQNPNDIHDEKEDNGQGYSAYLKEKKERQKSHSRSLRDKLLKQFNCLICQTLMELPLTTPCAHNFCKKCLEGAFAGQEFIRQRITSTGRTLRAQKNVMKCPCCPNDISDFLENPQVNRELMGLIESLQEENEKEQTDAGSSGDAGETDEKEDDAVEDTDEKLDETSENADGTDALVDEVDKNIDVSSKEEIEKHGISLKDMDRKFDGRSKLEDKLDEGAKDTGMKCDKKTLCRLKTESAKDGDKIKSVSHEENNLKTTKEHGTEAVDLMKCEDDYIASTIKSASPCKVVTQSDESQSKPKRGRKRKSDVTPTSPAVPSGGVRTRRQKVANAALLG